jgi:hypothetical protein
LADSCEHGNEPPGSIICGEFDEMSDCKLLKEGYSMELKFGTTNV